MDRSLDELLDERRDGDGSRRRRNAGGSDRYRARDYPRDGVRKSYRDRDDNRTIESDWLHDRYLDNDRHSRDDFRDSYHRRASPARYSAEPRGTKVRVDNLHYELTEDELDKLFNSVGQVLQLNLRYDRAGRSEGTAFVIYEYEDEAVEAVRQFNGANAAGQPITLSIVPSRPSSYRDSYRGEAADRRSHDRQDPRGRPLSERVSRPLADRVTDPRDAPSRGRRDGGSRRGRRTPSRSRSPARTSDSYSTYDSYGSYDGGGGSRRRGRRRRGGRRAGPAVDSYVPSPGPRRENNGRRPGERRRVPRGASDEPSRRGGPNERAGRGGRPHKTTDELDAEMDEYFGDAKVAGTLSENPVGDSAKSPAAAAAAAANTDEIAAPVATDPVTTVAGDGDVDMIE